MGDAAAAAALPTRAGLAAWLGALLAAICLLNTAGGWVRLSGSGVAIPHWPLIELDGGRRTLLPPVDQPGWDAAFTAWQEHQDALRTRIAGGELPASALGHQPGDAGGFRRMFLIEWFHRLLAAVVGILAVACLGTALADPGLRRRVGWPLAAAVGLIGLQAVLGALLVGEGTATRWLFVHQGNAALILACVLWALLRLLLPAAGPALRPGLLPGLALFAAWIQLMLGGMVASARAAGPLGVQAMLHHLNAVILAGLLVAAFRAAPAGSRQRLALALGGSFLAVEALFGIAAALLPRSELAVPLAHQFLGLCILLTLILAWFDARHEPAPGAAA
jgi:heme A synthase